MKKKCHRCGGKARTVDDKGYIHALCFSLEKEENNGK